MTGLRALLARLVPLGVLVLLAGACGVGSDHAITLHATFDDVADLVPQAHVRAGDVPIGLVTDIELTDDYRARVTMEVEPGTGLPERTAAVLAKTNLLGERYISLRPVGERGRLSDGQVLEDTRVVSSFDDLVRSGNEALAFVAADRLSAAVRTGATAFGGRGSLLGRFIEDLTGFVSRYEEGGDDLTRLIDAADSLTGRLASNAEDNADALAALERFSRALEEEDTRLLDALDDLNRLARVGDRIMRRHREQIDDLVRRVRVVLEAVTGGQGALDDLLTWLPRHNRHVLNGSKPLGDPEVGYAQVWLDFVLCGVNDEQGDPSEDCTPDNPGEHADQPPRHPNSEACMEDPDRCEIPDESGPDVGPDAGIGDTP